MRRHIDETMAITAIDPELRDVQIMRKRHWLDRLITDAGILRSDVIPVRRGQTGITTRAANRDFERQPIRPAWKKIRHSALSSELCFSEGVTVKINNAPQSCC